MVSTSTNHHMCNDPLYNPLSQGYNPILTRLISGDVAVKTTLGNSFLGIDLRRSMYIYDKFLGNLKSA